MEKTKKRKIRILGFKLTEIIRLGMIISACVGVAMYLDNKFDRIDMRFEKMENTMNRRFDEVDRRFDRIEGRLDNVEKRLDKTSSLLNNYLTWRFIYVNDPVRKHFIPVYDPINGTLEFVDKNKGK